MIERPWTCRRLCFAYRDGVRRRRESADDTAGHVPADRNVVRGDPSFLIVGLTAVLSADSIPEDTLTLRFARLRPRSGSAPETRSAGAPPEPDTGMPAEPVTRRR